MATHEVAVAHDQEKAAANLTAGRASNSGSDEKLEAYATNETTYTNNDQGKRQTLFNDGVVVLQPALSPDPKDPLRLTMTRKIMAMICLAFFGAMAAAAELILGAMLPVFALVYANIDPKFLVPLTQQAGGFPVGSNPLAALQNIKGAYPIWQIYLLASLPILVVGLSNFMLIPLAVAVGRRPVMIGAGAIAIGGAVWAGNSQSLPSHLGARCVQAIGAGTVEGLIPFIVQDIVHVHQRNTWISCIFAAQGLIIIGLGIGSPYLIISLDWRWLYFITAIVAAFFLVGIVFFLPETKWHRSKAEMDGIPRPAPSGAVYAPRTFAYDVALFHGKMEWAKGFETFWTTIKTFFYPNIFFITILNSAMIGAALAAAYTVAPALLTNPWTWNFYNLGLCLLPILVSAVAVGLLTGWGADKVANFFARRTGERTPEIQIINLILPTIAAVVGTVIFGISGAHQDKYPWIVFIVGLGLMAFGFLGANAVGAVYVLECYPHLTGTALMNIASIRALIAFLLSFRVAEWIVEHGYFKTMMIYVALQGAFACTLPIVYFYGASWRRRWPY